MRVNQGFLGWGVFLILVGAIPLAVNAGVIPADRVDDWWSFWPLILVGIGLGIILSRTTLNWLGGLVVAATFGIIVGSLAATGIGGIPFTGCGGGDEAGTPFPSRSGQFTGQASVHLDFNCGDLTVTAAQGSGWSLEGSDDTGEGPIVDSGDTSLRIESRERVVGFAIAAKDTWRVGLPTAVPLDLDIGLNAGSGDVDMTGASLGRVQVNMNAGDVRLDLGRAETLAGLDVGVNAGAIGITLPATSVTGAIEANAGSVKICVPSGVGLRLRTTDNLTASYQYDGQGLVHEGDTWTSPSFDSAAVKVDLATHGNAASFTLNPEDGCDG
jgi:hypothetical protein